MSPQAKTKRPARNGSTLKQESACHPRIASEEAAGAPTLPRSCGRCKRIFEYAAALAITLAILALYLASIYIAILATPQ